MKTEFATGDIILREYWNGDSYLLFVQVKLNKPNYFYSFATIKDAAFDLDEYRYVFYNAELTNSVVIEDYTDPNLRLSLISPREFQNLESLWNNQAYSLKEHIQEIINNKNFC